jgi:hypothetical protein
MHYLYLRLALIVLLLAAGASSAAAAPAAEEGSTTAVFFRETQNWIAPPFYQFWSKNGGLPIFGYPLAPTDLMTSPDDGNTYATQIFERNRLEYHPENPEPYRVQLGRLGVEVLQKQGRNWQDFPKGTPKRGCDFFPETGHTLCEPFRSYWRRYGLDLGFRGVTRAESIALFGLPISEPMMETNADGATVLTQWFERARFEYHPNNPPQYRVLLGLLGKELYGPYRPGVASVSGRVVERGMPFWDAVSNSGMQIKQASVGIEGPYYPEDHPLSGVTEVVMTSQGEISVSTEGWFTTLVDIQPDNSFAFSDFIPTLPGAFMMLGPGRIDGVCADGKEADFSSYGSVLFGSGQDLDFALEGGQAANFGDFRVNVICLSPPEPDARYHDAAFAAVQCAVGRPLTRDPEFDALAVEALRASAMYGHERVEAMLLEHPRVRHIGFFTFIPDETPSSDPCIFGGNDFREDRVLFEQATTIGVAVFPSSSANYPVGTLVIVQD